MATQEDRLFFEVRSLPTKEKVRILQALLADLDTTDPSIDRIWTEEAHRRLEAYKTGKLGTISYEDLMARYR